MAKRFYPKAYEPKPKKKRRGIHSKNRNTNQKNNYDNNPLIIKISIHIIPFILYFGSCNPMVQNFVVHVFRGYNPETLWKSVKFYNLLNY